MKKLLIFTLLIFSLTSQAAIKYVSPTGSDSNSGTITSPWFTLEHAYNTCSAGDIIYMRGGTYHYTEAQRLTGHSGTAGNYIQIFNYPGEKPIISGDSNPEYEIIYLHDCSYIYMKGIRCTWLPQPNPITTDNGYYGIILGGNLLHSKFEMVECDHIGGWGFVMGDGCDDILLKNCDSHHNQDPYTETYVGPHGTNYGGSDGFECGSATSTNVVLDGCRMWWNSDDGIDLRVASGLFTIKNCWVFRNGYIPDTYSAGGNGEGLKLQGPNGASANTTAIRRVAYNNIIFDNQAGIEGVPEPYYCGIQAFNNTVFRNYVGFNFQGAYATTTFIRNNINFGNTDAYYIDAGFVHDHNSFDLSVTANSSDFITIDTTGATGPRQSDGSLPVLNFFKLVGGSDLRGVGVAITGYTTDIDGNSVASPPDIGARAYTTTSGTVTAPVVSTTAISGLTSTSAISGGNVTSDGGAAVTDKGICWSTTPNPTTASTVVHSGTGAGVFASAITGLTKNTTYHVRAFATNSQGTSYGTDIQFSTRSYMIVVY